MNLTSTRVLASLMVAAGLALTAAATDQTTTLFPAVDTFETDESWFDPNVGNVVNAAADMAATDYKNLRYTNTDEANQYGVKAWTADGTDESTLVSETYDYSAQPFPMGLTAGSMFLNLNTAGATLSRQLGDYDDTTHEFTAGASFESDPIWVDTMIKFVKSDETPTSIPADVKLAMWVDADNYLVIYSATMDDEGTILDPVATTTTIAIDADSWYRVTVETIAIDSSIFAWLSGISGMPSLPTVLEILKAIGESCIVSFAPRYDIIGLKTLEFNHKAYCCDTAFVNSKKSLVSDLYGSLYETVVYNELVARGYTVRTGTANGREIDFVVSRGDGDRFYVQVAYEITPGNLKREFGNYDAVPDHYPKLVVSRDRTPVAYRGVRHINIVDFLTAADITSTF